MSIITLIVEASTGVLVKKGQKVRQGDEVGMATDFKSKVVVPVDGEVIDCSFNPEDHTFVIQIQVIEDD
jgi:glycine cleavage system H lipoate-binding protein